MNRRGFLSILGKAAVGGAVAYSFPEIIVPKNIEKITGFADAIEKGYTFSGYSKLNEITLKEVYPKVIDDLFFQESPFLARMRSFEDNIALELLDKQLTNDIQEASNRLEKAYWGNVSSFNHK